MVRHGQRWPGQASGSDRITMSFSITARLSRWARCCCIEPVPTCGRPSCRRGNRADARNSFKRHVFGWTSAPISLSRARSRHRAGLVRSPAALRWHRATPRARVLLPLCGGSSGFGRIRSRNVGQRSADNFGNSRDPAPRSDRRPSGRRALSVRRATRRASRGEIPIA